MKRVLTFVLIVLFALGVTGGVYLYLNARAEEQIEPPAPGPPERPR